MESNDSTNEETKTQTEEETQAPTEQTPQSSSMIDNAHKAAERMEKAAADLKAENDRYEKNKSYEMLGGSTDAGQAPAKPKEETPKEYRARIEKELAEGKHR